MNNDQQKLVDFSKAIAQTLYCTDGVKWPIRSGNIITPVGDIFATEYIRQMKRLVLEYPKHEWKNAFPNSLSIWRMAHHIINGLEKQGLPKDEIAQDCLLMINIIDTITNGESIYRDYHRILDQASIDALFLDSQKPYFSPHTNDYLSLATLLWAYTESIYFQGKEISCEYHGPYRLQDGTFAIVREYANLYPTDLWPGLLPCNQNDRIKIVTFHDNRLSFVIDAYNNVSVPSGTFNASCTGGLLYINEVLTSPSMVSALLSEYEKKLLHQMKCVSRMTTESIYRKYLDIFWYRKKKLSVFLSEDWLPPLNAVNRIIQTDIVPVNVNMYRANKSMEELAERYNYSSYL